MNRSHGCAAVTTAGATGRGAVHLERGRYDTEASIDVERESARCDECSPFNSVGTPSNGTFQAVVPAKKK